MLMILSKDFFIERCTSTGSGHASAVVLSRFSGKSLLKEERHLAIQIWWDHGILKGKALLLACVTLLPNTRF